MNSSNMPLPPALPMAVLEPILSLAARSAASLEPVTSSLAQLLAVLPHHHVPAILRLALLHAATSTPQTEPDIIPTPATSVTLDRFVNGVLGAANVASDDGQQFKWYMTHTILPLLRQHPATFGRTFIFTVAKHGHLHTVQWLHDGPDGRPALLAQAGSVLAGASRGGHVPILDYWQTHGLLAAHAFTHQVAQQFGIGGHVSVAQWWRAQQVAGRVSIFGPNAMLRRPPLEAAGRYAFDHGNVALLDWLFSTYDRRPFFEILGDVWTRASELGNVALLDWALGKSFQLPQHGHDINHKLRRPRPMDLASSVGSLAVLAWWRQVPMDDDRQKLFLYSHRAMESASAAGRVDILDWWLQSGLELAFTPSAVQVALDNGHSHVVQWWHRTCPQYKHVLFGGGRQNEHNDCWIPKHPITLAAFGQLDWIKAHCASFDIVCAFDAIMAAVQFGHVRVLEKYHSFELLYLLCADENERVPSVAARHGQLGVLQWWFRRESQLNPFPYDKPSRGTTGNGLTGRVLGCCRQNALVGDHAHVLEWLFAHPTMQWDLGHDGEYIVDVRKRMVQYALENGGVKCLDVMFGVGMVLPSMLQDLDLDSLPQPSQEWWRVHFSAQDASAL